MLIFTCVFVFLTLVLSGLATLFLTLSLLSNEWEYLGYKEDKVLEISQAKNHTLQWLPGNLGKLEMENPVADKLDSPNQSRNQRRKKKTYTIVYLIPARGGVHKMCADITESARKAILEDGYKIERCISYLSNDEIISKDAWLDRMRNLAMSCAMVCLILLGFSAPLGIFGLIKKQISSIMVTGVMYMLAAVFGVFNLAFMHFKRVKPDGYYTSTILDLNLPEEYLKSRQYTPGWPPSAEWAGLGLCLIGSLFWLILAKIFRFQILQCPS